MRKRSGVDGCGCCRGSARSAFWADWPPRAARTRREWPGTRFPIPSGPAPSRAMTGSLADKPAKVPTTAVQAQPLPAPQMTQRPPAGTLYNQPGAPAQTPAPAASASRPAPVTQTGPGGWTAAGGAPITVGADDSLAVISTRYGVPERAILSANGLSNAAQVTPGRQIVIPVYDAGARRRPLLRRKPRPRPRRKAQSGGPAEASVRRRAEARRQGGSEARQTRAEDGGQGGPKKHPRPGRDGRQGGAEGRSQQAPAPWPDGGSGRQGRGQARDEDKGSPGQQTTSKPAPAAVEAARKSAAPQKPDKVARAEANPSSRSRRRSPRPGSSRLSPSPSRPSQSRPSPRPPPRSRKPPPRSLASTGAVPQNPSADFRWPARGRVIAGYGGGSGNEGINIAVPEGTPVKAAEGGTVAYAGSEVKGYGNLVLVAPPRTATSRPTPITARST